MIRAKKVKKWIIVFAFLVLALFAYRSNPYQLEFLGYYNKIWAHRVNSLDKLALSTPFFNGVELDLVYNDGVLEVRHPPKPFNGLTFNGYVEALSPDDYSLGFWLDIKNLDPANMLAVLSRLKHSLEKTDIDFSQIVVESQNPLTLQVFHEEGFKTSYYLPAKLRKLPEETQQQFFSKTYEQLKLKPWMALSTHFKDYELLSTHFKTRDKYIWITQYQRIEDYRLIRKVLKDTTVKVALIPYRSIRGN